LERSAAGGVFFGLFSCGGYHWHEQLFWLVFAVGALGTIVTPPQALRAWPRRAGVVALAVIAFVTIRAVASAFYPATPGSWRQFAQAVLSGLLYGPC
jgi:hypothetical protein